MKVIWFLCQYYLKWKYKSNTRVEQICSRKLLLFMKPRRNHFISDTWVIVFLKTISWIHEKEFMMETQKTVNSAGGSQPNRVLAFEGRSCRLESSDRLSNSPPGSPLLAVTPFLENDTHCYFISKLSKKIKGQLFSQLLFTLFRSFDSNRLWSYCLCTHIFLLTNWLTHRLWEGWKVALHYVMLRIFLSFGVCSKHLEVSRFKQKCVILFLLPHRSHSTQKNSMA